MIRKINDLNNELVKYYEFKIEELVQLSSKSYKLKSNYGNNYFIKETKFNALEKYHFLYNQGCNNILYPILNKEEKYVTRNNNKAIYVNNYYETFTTNNDIKFQNLVNELSNLHQRTSVKKQLNPSTSRPKFDEISNRLDFQFRLIEDYIRSIERKELNNFRLQILSNYHHILDAKKELIRLQKKVISYVKAKEGVEYHYIHNNPRLDHLLNVKGSYYLSSVENGKIGINSLDLAKAYIENSELNVDYKSIFLETFKNENNQFYYDYFRYLILLIYITRLKITNIEHIDANSFIKIALDIKKYHELFSDYQE